MNVCVEVVLAAAVGAAVVCVLWRGLVRFVFYDVCWCEYKIMARGRVRTVFYEVWSCAYKIVVRCSVWWCAYQSFNPVCIPVLFCDFGLNDLQIHVRQQYIAHPLPSPSCHHYSYNNYHQLLFMPNVPNTTSTRCH